MTQRRHDQKLARAMQDFARHDKVDVAYTRLLHYAQEHLAQRRPEEGRDEFAARLWLQMKESLTA